MRAARNQERRMLTLFRCDQCAYEEWRQEDEPVTLCVVCGYMMWEPVASATDGGDGLAAAKPEDGTPAEAGPDAPGDEDEGGAGG